jgi:hypothetical protein
MEQHVENMNTMDPRTPRFLFLIMSLRACFFDMLLSLQKCSPSAQVAKGKKALVAQLQALQATSLAIPGPSRCLGTTEGAPALAQLTENSAKEGSQAVSSSISVYGVDPPVVTGLVASGALDIGRTTDLSKLTVRIHVTNAAVK